MELDCTYKGEKTQTNATMRTGPSGIKGLGCFALKDFAVGDLIGEYTGERITSEEADRRHAEAQNFYIFMLESGTCIDPLGEEGNIIKYINHSCDPNCESEEDDGHIYLKAIKPIKKDAEITFDYCVVADDDEDLKCLCGAANCKGTMRDTDDETDDDDDEDDEVNEHIQ